MRSSLGHKTHKQRGRGRDFYTMHALCALYGTFCTSNSRACVLCSIRHSLHIKLSGMCFVLYTAHFAHQTPQCTFCGLYSMFCKSNAWMADLSTIVFWLLHKCVLHPSTVDDHTIRTTTSRKTTSFLIHL